MRMCKLEIHTIPRHSVNTIWKKKLEQFYIYIEIDIFGRCEQSWMDERDLSHMV